MGSKLSLRRPWIHALTLSLALTALLAVSPAQAFRFVVMGDSPQIMDKWPRQGFNKECLDNIIDQILLLNPKPDFVFFLGDLVTRAYSDDGHRFLPDWQATMKRLPDNNIKVYVALGNRDLYGSQGWPPQKGLEDEFRNFFSVSPFNMPDNGPGTPYNYKKLVYSFEYGTAAVDKTLFVVLDNFGFYQDPPPPPYSMLIPPQKSNWVNWDNGLDDEQLNWFYQQAQFSDARFKFVLSHGPAFSPEGYSPSSKKAGDSLREVWRIMETFSFTGYFAGHEHIFSRWPIDQSVDPTITRIMTQTLAGTAGAYPDDPSAIKKKENIAKAHIWAGYNFVVADVNPSGVLQRAYGVTKETGRYQTKMIDQIVLFP